MLTDVQTPFLGTPLVPLKHKENGRTDGCEPSIPRPVPWALSLRRKRTNGVSTHGVTAIFYVFWQEVLFAVRPRAEPPQYSLRRWGVTCLFKDVSHETPDVTPCRTSPPMPFLGTRPVRNAWCHTKSRLTAAGSTSLTASFSAEKFHFSTQPLAISWRVRGEFVQNKGTAPRKSTPG